MIFCISTKTDHDWCSISVPTHKLARGSDLVESSSVLENRTCRVSRPNRQLATQFQTLIHLIVTTAANGEFESSPAATCVEAELIKVASLIIGQRQGDKPNPEGRPRLSREEIIRRSKERRRTRSRRGISGYGRSVRTNTPNSLQGVFWSRTGSLSPTETASSG